jgi:glycosyltransferase involved in cell wall biosynthesis
MKIIHIITSLSKGGGERVAVELANEAAKNGNEVLLVAAWKEDPAYLQNQVNSKVTIEFISNTNEFAYVKLFSWIFNNRKTIKEYDIFHCHLTYGAVAGTLVYFFLKKILGYKKPFVVETNHAVGMPVPKFRRWLHSRMLLMRDGVAMMATDPYWQ